MKIHNQQYDEARIIRLRRQGLSMTTIGKRMGMSRYAVRDVLRKAEAQGGGPRDER